MFILAAFIYYLSTALAAPVPADLASTTDATNTRTLRDIVVSCLTTIFACTWVSMHPNIPAPSPEDWRPSFWAKMWWSIKKFFRRSVPTFLVALCFPEYIVGWAIRQRLIARSYFKVIDDPKFTITHSFFVIMGGVYKKTENGSYPLDRTQVAGLLGVNTFTLKDIVGLKVGEPVIQLPCEAELQDKSKSDWLAKLLVLIQTLWFIIQCIARRIEHLPITELEVITLAYAVLNLAIYIAWWDKPSRVDRATIITADVTRQSLNMERSFLETLVYYVLGRQDNIYHLNDQKEAPNFYNGEPSYPHYQIASSISFTLGIAFGAIHCIDWYFRFTGLTEQKLWRVSSLLLTGAPFIGMVFIATGYLYVSLPLGIRVMLLGGVIRLVRLASPLILLGYLAARIATIYIALHSLPSLPSDVFIAVQWTNLIPHI